MIQNCKGCACETECDDGICPECYADAAKIFGPRIDELEARLKEVAHAYDVMFNRRVELEHAIIPFAEFGIENVTDDATWKSNIHREPISAWFGPSDFLALAKLKS